MSENISSVFLILIFDSMYNLVCLRSSPRTARETLFLVTRNGFILNLASRELASNESST